MANSTVNLTYVGQGPTVNGQNLASQTSGPLAKRLLAYGQTTLDGANSTVPVNWVDGSVTPFGSWSGPAGNQSFTAAVPAAALEGTKYAATDTATVVPIGVHSLTTTGCTLVLSGNGSAAQLLSFCIEIYPSLT